MKLTCTVNGADIVTDVEPRLLLSDFLRHHLRLTGTHVGCETGICGACTVIVDGVAVRSCLVFAAQMDGLAIRTIEGVGTADAMDDLQDAFHRHHALQCGFCTPGILMTLVALRDAGELPADEAGVRDVLSGNICRCTGYQPIVDAVLSISAT